MTTADYQAWLQLQQQGTGLQPPRGLNVGDWLRMLDEVQRLRSLRGWLPGYARDRPAQQVPTGLVMPAVSQQYPVYDASGTRVGTVLGTSAPEAFGKLAPGQTLGQPEGPPPASGASVPASQQPPARQSSYPVDAGASPAPAAVPSAYTAAPLPAAPSYVPRSAIPAPAGTVPAGPSWYQSNPLYRIGPPPTVAATVPAYPASAWASNPLYQASPYAQSALPAGM